jgi:hypothetical protein
MSDTRILVRPYVIGPTDTSFVVPAGGGVGTLSVDGTATGGGSTATSFTVTLSTTKTNDVILLFVQGNGLIPSNVAVTSANVTWHNNRSNTGASGNILVECVGTASAILTSEVITVNVVSNIFCDGFAIAINGADISSYPTSIFDGNGSIPATGTTGTPSGISTTAAATIIVAGIRGNDDGTQPGGWSTFGRGIGLFAAVDYQIFASTQSGLGIADTMTGINGWIADAVKASGQ